MIGRVCFIAVAVILSVGGIDNISSPVIDVDMVGSQVITVAERMVSVVEGIESIQCKMMIRYYRCGDEYKHYQFIFFTDKDDNVHLRFLHPYRGMSVFYRRGDNKVTIRPFRFLPMVRFRISLDNPLVISPSGQRIDQGTLGYLTRFFYDNREIIRRNRSRYSAEGNRLECMFWAKNYTGKTDLNRYRLVVLKENYLPVLIERYTKENNLIEIMTFEDYIIRFTPGHEIKKGGFPSVE